MRTYKSRLISVAAALALAGLPCLNRAFAETREEILAGAKKEGRLVLSPGYDKSTISPLVKGFTKKYPFIEVSWNIVTGITAAQRQLFEMASGKAALDVFSPSTAHWSDYLKQNLYNKKYNFRGMAKAGQLNIPIEMVDESGMVVWLGSNTAVLAYNASLVPAENAPKGWESCLDPKWKGKLAVDTKPNTLTWLIPLWGIEKVLDFAKRLKENDPVWVRGQTGTLARLGAGEFSLDCSMYLHTARRNLKRDPTLPVKLVIPSPVAVAFHEPEGIYVGAKNPNAGLLWIEYLASREAQEVVDSADPGKASFLVEGTISQKLIQGVNVALCSGDCRNREDELMARIAVEAWGLPKVGYTPKK